METSKGQNNLETSRDQNSIETSERLSLSNIISYRTKVWLEKSSANFTKSPNFICQTFCNSTTIISIFNVFAKLYFTKLIFK